MGNPLKALIDADLCTYGIGFTTQDLPQDQVPIKIDQTIQRIIDAVSADEHQLYLTMDGRDGFRYKVCSNYKAHRVQDKPIHYDFIRTYMCEHWNAKMVSDIEADDCIGINQDKEGEDGVYNTIICSLDKDLDMIPGMHYRWPIYRNNEEIKPARFYCVEEPDATRWLYSQLLIGDTSDNIIGVKGIGKVKAEKLLEGLDDEKEMFDLVRDLYADDNRFLKNGQLLWIHRKQDDYWEHHYERLLDGSTL